MRWPTNLRKRLFPLEITKRIYLGMVVLMLVPTLVLSAVTYYQFFAIERLSRTDTLYEAATQLDLAIKSSFGSFDNILSTHQTEQLSYQQKIDLLNDAIQPVLLKVAARYPGFGLGIYSAKMDSVLAFSPKFNRTQLVSLPHNSPLFSAYNTAKPALILSNGLPNAEGNSSLSLSYPIYSAGTVVGVAWATVKMGDVYLGALTRASTSLLIGFGLIGILGFSSWWMFSKFHRELENFAQAVVEERPELPEGILPELNPLLQLVKGRTYALQELNSQLQSEVNQRHKAQEELLHLAYLVESTGDAIIGIVNGTIVSWNSGAEKMYGYSAQEIRGQHISSLFVRQNTPYMDDINDRLAKGEQ
ncbi:MAG: PAS domain S-box protein, partial [Peptococcaceae bacterium]|nr:PAS domain S-box protein [Peptococcaceae bacterium]